MDSPKDAKKGKGKKTKVEKQFPLEKILPLVPVNLEYFVGLRELAKIKNKGDVSSYKQARLLLDVWMFWWNNVQTFMNDIKLRKERLKTNLDVFQEFEEQLKLRKQRDTKDLNRLNKTADSVMVVYLLWSTQCMLYELFSNALPEKNRISLQIVRKDHFLANSSDDDSVSNSVGGPAQPSEKPAVVRSIFKSNVRADA